ncbi:MAG: uracil-DNA glycosylase [Geobacter sp.]|nr:uracil-DNA glycosylase [Geobacter sp.]
MKADLTLQETLGGLRVYLEELAETGVDGLPLAAGVETSETASPGFISEATPETGRETLDEIRQSMGECGRCSLGDGRTNLVFGVGNPHARLVFVGEAPGRDEDLKGEPFVGEAGHLLTKIIQAMGFERSEVYICNVLKCRPPNNRDPLPSEVEACGSFMLRQVRSIGPQVIVALGRFAAQTLLSTNTPISKLRGQFHDYHGIPLMPTYHPAALLRDAALKRDVWEDMKQVMGLLGKEVSGKGK